MIFDPATGALYHRSGRLMKVLHCPLGMSWSDLEGSPEETARRCGVCTESVVNLEHMGDDEVEALFLKNPFQCVYLRLDVPNITVLQSESIAGFEARLGRHRDLEQARNSSGQPEEESGYSYAVVEKPEDGRLVISTARGEDEINAGVRRGFKPVLARVPTGGDSPCKMPLTVFQHTKNGEVLFVTDSRSSPHGPDWKVAIDWFEVYPYPRTSPIAAYLVPPGLPNGTEVVLEDPIEDVVGFRHHGVYRASMVPAIWTGRRFNIRHSEDDIPHVIG